MKQITFVFFLIFLVINCSFAQAKLNTTLYYDHQSYYSIGCGVINYASVMTFMSDSSRMGDNVKRYNVVILCPELYGEGFFKKGAKYKLTLSRDYKKIRTLFTKNNYSDLRKGRNLYFCEEIEIIK